MSRVEVPDVLVPKNGGNFPVAVPFTQANVAAASVNVNIDVGQSVLMLDTLREWITVPPASFATSATCVNADHSQLVLKGTLPNGGGPGVVVTGLAALKALSGVVGQTVHETSRGFSWKALPYGDATADDVTVVNAMDGSVTWILMVGTVDVAKWRAVTDWYVDGANSSASDWNMGDSSHPLKTTDEIQRRCGTPWDLGDADRAIHLLTATVNGRVEIDYTSNNDQCTLYINDVSTRTTLASGTLATYASPANREATVISVTGIATWTSLVGTRMNFGAQGYARVIAANPEGVGATYARISLPQIGTSIKTDLTPHYGHPAIGQSVTVETLGVTVSHLSIQHRSSLKTMAATPWVNPALIVTGVNIRSARVDIPAVAWVKYKMVDCDIVDMLCSPLAVTQFGGTAAAGAGLYINQLLYGAAIVAVGPLAEVLLRGCSGMGHTDVVAQGCDVEVYDQNVLIQNFAIFESPGDGIYIHNLGSVYLTGYLYGNGNTGYGLRMSTASQLVASGAILAIGGAAGDVGCPSGVLTCAQALPRKWDRGAGSFTIIAGNSVTVSVPALPADAIVKAWSNAAVGKIQVDTQTTSGFRVFSSESPTDLCSGFYEWFSPSTRPGGIVA